MATASLETVLDSRAIVPSVHHHSSAEDLIRSDFDHEIFAPDAPLEDALEPWAHQLDTAIRHVGNLMAQNHLFEADRVLFLTIERFGWHQSLGYLQQQLDRYHRMSREKRVSRLLAESEADHAAGCLDLALEKLEKVLTLSPRCDQALNLQQLVLQKLAEREKGRRQLLEDSGDFWCLADDTQMNEREDEIQNIASLIASGRFDDAATELEMAIDQWGVCEELNDLYEQIVAGQASVGPDAQSVRENEQIAELLTQATVALETKDLLKARLLVAEVLTLHPAHSGAIALARSLDGSS